jgi:hypothetical protein
MDRLFRIVRLVAIAPVKGELAVLLELFILARLEADVANVANEAV